MIVHAWEMSKGSLGPSHMLQQEVKERIKQHNIAEYKLAALLGRSESTVRRMLGKRDGGVRVNNFFAITDFLGIDRSFAEKEIIVWRDQSRGWRPYTKKFPFELTPLAFRITAHLIGDGKPSRGGFFQKSAYISYMVDLIEKVLDVRVDYYEDYKGVCELSIPNFLIQCISTKLDLPQSKMKSKAFFDKVCELPKDYRVQAVAAFFVDEGSIKTGRIRFAQKNREVLKGFVSVLDSLEYSHTEIRPAKTKLKGEDFYYHYLDLYADGAKTFFDDANNHVKKYGALAGLWQKHHAVKEYLQSTNVELSLKRREAKKTQEILLEKFLGSTFSVGDILNEFGVSYSRAFDLLRSLRKKGKTKRIGRGLYQIVSGELNEDSRWN